MGITIDVFEAGPIQTNAYLVGDDETKHALVIDAPKDVVAPLTAAIAAGGWTITGIVLTHTHWDHIADATPLVQALGVPLLAPKLAVDRLAKPGSMVTELPFTIRPVTPDRLLDEGDEVALGSHRFRVWHLPGHEPSHIALVSEEDRLFFGGDVVFPGGHGTTEVPGADQATMNRSLARLIDLPPETVVWPGHGLPTTIGAELGWLREYAERGGTRQ